MAGRRPRARRSRSSRISRSRDYTLTVALNFETGRLYGFASNDKEWYPVSGTLEEVE